MDESGKEIVADPSDSASNRSHQSVKEEEAREIKREKFLIWKDVLSICLSFLFLFSAVQVTSVLQSSLNAENGLGTTAQSTVYIGQIISSMFLPTLVIKKLGLKWTMVVSQLCYCSYMTAQFYPTYYTLIPTAAMTGLAAAPLWTAESTFLTKAGTRYTKLIGKELPEPVIARFFGILFMCTQISNIVGNLVSSTVFSKDPSTAKASTLDELQLDHCGANFCFSEWTDNANVTNAVRPPKSQINLVFGIMLGLELLAALTIAVLVRPPEKIGKVDGPKRSAWKMVIATFSHMKNPYQILIIPLTMWNGFQMAFVAAGFTAAFITCAWGVEHIGYVMVCSGFFGAIASISCGYLVKLIGRMPIIICGALVQSCVLLTMQFIWYPDPTHPEMFYIMAALWGSCSAVWNTQTNSFYGFLFPHQKEAAFSNFRLWQSLGFAIGFAYNPFVCINVQLYIIWSVLLAGIAGYLTIEVKERRNKKTES